MSRTLLIAILCWVSALSLVRADGDLDPSFGWGGRVLTDFFTTNLHPSSDVAYSALVQPDNKIVAVSDVYNSLTEANYLGLARYESNGALDANLGNAGLAATRLEWAHVAGVALQPDGKILVGASTGSPSGAIVALRYLPDGSLDPAFGNGGIVQALVFGAFAGGVGLQGDGKFVVAATTVDSTSAQSFAVARFDTNGTVDATFGLNGVASLDPSGNGDCRLNAMTLQSDGRVVGVGTARPAGKDEVALVRFDSAGNPDPLFGTRGVVVTDAVPGDSENALAVAQQTDGRLVVAGSALQAPLDTMLLRYNGDGSLDESFGTGGIALPGLVNDRAVAVAIEPDGKIVTAEQNDGVYDFLLARFTSSGILDPTFGGGGIVDTPFSGAPAAALAVLNPAAGTLLAVGAAETEYSGSSRFRVGENPVRNHTRWAA